MGRPGEIPSGELPVAKLVERFEPEGSSKGIPEGDAETG
jgi:hypothetical protein